METIVVWVTVVTLAAVSGTLVGLLIRSIRQQHVKRIWANFGLSLAFCALFLVTWIAHGIAEWGVYVQNQREHGEPTEVSEYVVQFGQSTLENWQSEFLQLFSFVVFAAVLIHKGSAESKDGDEEMRAALRRIEKRLDELHPVAG
jgi:branched-subunit amino acid ABC-type transport system permease component